MRSSILVIVSLLALLLAGPVGCKKKAPPESRLYGSWVIDADATIAQLPDDQQQMAKAFIHMMKMGLVFKDDHTLEMKVALMGQKNEQNGTYKLVKSENDNSKLTLKLIRDKSEDEKSDGADDQDADKSADASSDDDKDVATMVVTFTDDDHITFAPVAEEGESDADVARDTLVLKRIDNDKLQAYMDKEPAKQPSLQEMKDMLGAPGAQPGAPGAQPGAPGAQPGAPGAQPGAPGAQPGAPGAQPGAPGAQPGAPGADAQPSAAGQEPAADDGAKKDDAKAPAQDANEADQDASDAKGDQ